MNVINKVGIDKISFYAPKSYIDMVELAHARDVDPGKYTIGIGQDRMAQPAIEEDIVAMAANAAYQILEEDDKNSIDQIIFATESGFDYSKSAGIYLHELLNIQPNAKAYEIKQACYSGTAALMLACDYVRLRPDRKVLVVTSDISRYGLNTGGEPTQGAGAVAFTVAQNPAVLAIDLESVSVTRNEFDFWRPDHHAYPVVEGKFSTELYLTLFIETIDKYAELYPERLVELQALVFHTPFTRMGKKALQAYLEKEETALDPQLKNELLDRWLEIYDNSILVNRQVGNIYTGSLYLSLISLLVHGESLKVGDKLGLFSYGSGAVAEFFTGELQAGFKVVVNKKSVYELLDRRRKISIEDYEALFDDVLPRQETYHIPAEKIDFPGFYLAGVDGYRRQYGYKPAE